MGAYYEPKLVPALLISPEMPPKEAKAREVGDLLNDPMLRERRRSPRYAANQRAVLTQINPVTFGKTTVLITDISKDGLRIHLSCFLYPGTTVQVRWGRIIATSEVRYCFLVGNEYAAGLAVGEVFDGVHDMQRATS